MEFPKLTKEIAEKIDEYYEEELERIKKEEPRFIRLDLLSSDFFDIDIDDIEYLELEDVFLNHRIEEGYKFLEKSQTCMKATIVLSKRINDKYRTYRDNISIFDRLTNKHDIANIAYLNGYQEFLERIYMPWNDYDSYENSNQKEEITEDGDLTITIAK